MSSAQKERLSIHRHEARPNLRRMPFLSPNACDGRAEHDARVLYRVVAVHFEIALSADRQVNKPLTGDGREAYDPKSRCRRYVGIALAVKLDPRQKYPFRPSCGSVPHAHGAASFKFSSSKRITAERECASRCSASAKRSMSRYVSSPEAFPLE